MESFFLEKDVHDVFLHLSLNLKFIQNSKTTESRVNTCITPDDLQNVMLTITYVWFDRAFFKVFLCQFDDFFDKRGGF